MTSIKALRGMNDMLPAHSVRWQRLQDICRRVFEVYAYRRIATPVLEKTALFARSIGEQTDIVAKEMYTFEDRNAESLTLRPEGTAGCVRAGIEHGLFHNQQQRLWYAGPMFRYERPQRGRFRQFYQVGVEAYGWAGPDIDAEIIALARRLFVELGIAPPRLEVNSLGSAASRDAYRDELVAFLTVRAEELDADSQRRLGGNPLRVLDSKDPGTRAVLQDAPSILDYLDDASRAHFDALCAQLEQLGIDYQVNPRLVRGLDYYDRTVFEWVSEDLGAQGSVCGGGRYDGLVETLGGRATPAVGFAFGVERLLELVAEDDPRFAAAAPQVYGISDDGAARGALLDLAERLRDAGVMVQTHCGEGGIRNQMKRADRSGAALAVIVGEREIERREVAIKPLRGGEQRSVALDDTVKTVQDLINSL